MGERNASYAFKAERRNKVVSTPALYSGDFGSKTAILTKIILCFSSVSSGKFQDSALNMAMIISFIFLTLLLMNVPHSVYELGYWLRRYETTNKYIYTTVIKRLRRKNKLENLGRIILKRILEEQSVKARTRFN